jgi:hypothetical protein
VVDFKRKLRDNRRGEDLLSTIDSVVLKLENGETVYIRIADELSVSDDPQVRYREALKAHARFAFWSYQAARALATLRRRESEMAAAEGADYLLYRTYIQEHTDVEMATEGNIRARMNALPSAETKTAKAALAEAQQSYGVLCAMRDASEHRSNTLRRAIAHENEAG